MTTGIFKSGSICAVLALKALQNSMMFTPCWPNAGPIGGAGLAFPAGTCNLTYPVIFFAMIHFQLPVGNFQSGSLIGGAASTQSAISSFFFRKRNFFYIKKIQLHRRRASKDRHRHL